MSDRKEICLDSNDVIAAAQIVSWIARPHRPESGVSILNQWYWINRKKAGGSLPNRFDLKLEKPGRIGRSFQKLEADCIMALRAGIWAQAAVLKATPHHWFENFTTGIRALGEARAVERGSSAGNEIRDVWSKRKSVAHLCLAATNALAAHHQKRNWIGFGLRGAMLEPDWVSEAIEHSHEWSRSLAKLPNASPTIHFYRDNF
jgi:hypothetical protein